MDQVAHAKPPGLGFGQDALDFIAIGKLNLAARGVNHQLRNKIPGHLFLLCKEQVAEMADTGKLLAIGGFATGIDGKAQAVFPNATAVEPAPGPVALAGGAVAGAVTANGIEMNPKKIISICFCVLSKITNQLKSLTYFL